MQKVYLFVFITLLPIAIQAEDDEFVENLFNLHNTERESRNLEKLDLDTVLCLEAKKVAKQFVNPNTEEPYVHTPDGDKRMNIYSSKHDSLASIKELDPNDIFVYWLHYEKAFNTKKELSENPIRIHRKDIKKIGIGYETFGNSCVVVALYDPKNINEEPHKI